MAHRKRPEPDEPESEFISGSTTLFLLNQLKEQQASAQSHHAALVERMAQVADHAIGELGRVARTGDRELG